MGNGAAQESGACRSVSKRQPPVVIYLGYHKTASKWIWKHFFNQYYPSRQVNLFEQSAAELQDAIAAADGPFVLRQRVESGSMGAELPALAETIGDTFPEARIVVGIRSQRSMLASHYGQYVTNGGRLGFAAYLDETIKTKWHYQAALEPFLERFGDRMFVYLFEDLRNDSAGLLCQLRDFIGPPAGGLSDPEIQRVANLPAMNPQRNDLTVDTMLLLNRLRMRHKDYAIFPIIRRRDHDHILVEATEYIANIYARRFGRPLRYRKFDDHGMLDRAYAAENQALSALLKRPLAEYGYPG